MKSSFVSRIRMPILFIAIFGVVAVIFQNCSDSRLGLTEQDSLTNSPLSIDPLSDIDGDGLGLDEEKDNGTDPDSADSDGDGLSDGAEVNTHGTNPNDPDTDRGGMSDGTEVTLGRNPTNPNDDQADESPSGDDGSDDSDNDGLSNSDETNIHGTNPNQIDTDGDGLNDGEEVNNFGTNPLVKDTDRGGFEDGYEVSKGLNPLNPNDDFVWGDWSIYQDVMACNSNGKKSQERMRVCIEGNCVGPELESRIIDCDAPVDGGWSSWSVWSPWSNATGACGTRTSTRTCNQPAPQFGGNDCVGSTTTTQTKPCESNEYGSCPSGYYWDPRESQCFVDHNQRDDPDPEPDPGPD